MNKYGRLVIISSLIKNNRTHYVCRCDCGRIKTIRRDSLLSGKIKSCGCLQKEIISVLTIQRNTTHNMSKTRFNSIYRDMKRRCLNKNVSNYKNYGGRGITVCDRWLKFENFKEDMYEEYLRHTYKFGEKDTTIERINNDGNYDPFNCKWATRLEQMKNQKQNRFFIAVCPDGGVYWCKNRSCFARKFNLNNSCLRDCIVGRQKTHKGWVFKNA